MTKLKSNFIKLCIFINIATIWAQQNELGMVVGSGNYIGDIGREQYFYPNKTGWGIVFKRTINPWFSARLNLNYFQISAKDSEAESAGRRIRNFSSEADILNFDVGIEYNFIARNPFLQLQSIHKITPYFFTGIGLGSYSGKFYQNISNKSAAYKFNGANLNIPMVLGLKYKVSSHFIIALETGAYYYFTDNLDGTSGFYGNEKKILNDGIIPTTNLHSNDWYTFTSVSFIYTFGDLSCFFNLY